jgi:hypothetical protein
MDNGQMALQNDLPPARHTRSQFPWAKLQYLYLLRVPILMGVMLFFLPMVSLFLFRQLLENLFVVGTWNIFWTVIATEMLAFGILVVTRVVLLNGLERFDIPQGLRQDVIKKRYLLLTESENEREKHERWEQRLAVKTKCTAVTGTIVDATNGKWPDGVRHEPDGDTHGWLKVDPDFENLLNAGNKGKEGGNLVFEVVCKFPVTQSDAIAACQGFTNPVKIPAVGSHVRIVGSYVQDMNHARWMEIHPVTSITVIP